MAEGASAAADEGGHRLQRRWKYWENEVTAGSSEEAYKKSLHAVHEFGTVEGFWRFWNNYPTPMKLFGDGRGDVELQRGEEKYVVDAINIFAGGIEPLEEHPDLRRGCHLRYRVQASALRDVDDRWLRLTLHLIGEVLHRDRWEEIVGLRLVHKSKGPKGGRSIIFELWMSCVKPGSAMKQAFADALGVSKDDLEDRTKYHKDNPNAYKRG